LIEKLNIEQESLTEMATWYDLEKAVAAMYQCLHDEFKGSDDVSIFLPSESEFSALKEQYGVS
jgi:acyl-coenzyme A synthetase/AMP-(fatty) acid ligase